jgi:Fe2+ or Zn2+ uptake regulation protein
MGRDVMEMLRRYGIRPSAQRVAVASYVLNAEDHPSADQVWNTVKQGFPMLSRATTYNTLNLFVRKGLLRQLDLAEGRVVFDPNTERHHHLIDEETRRIYDIPWDALEVRNVEGLGDFEVEEYQVVLRGKRKAGNREPGAGNRSSS